MQKFAAKPLYFGSPERPRAGWLHRAGGSSSPTGGSSRTGVVICNPFGYEAICAHRTLRHFAESVARAGVSALRFDYDGTGDSAGDDRDPDRLSAWVSSVRDACRTMRERCGVDRVILVGVRFGVLVAALAAVDEDVAGLVAIAPVVSGKAYLRELVMRQRTLELGEPPAGITPAPDELEAAGFVITHATRDAIARVDLTELSLGREGVALQLLVLDREDLPIADKWVDRLAADRVEVDARRALGFVEMMLDPHKAVVPEGMVRAATEWIAARAGEPSRARSTDAAFGTDAALGAEARMGGVVERAVFVDEARRVFGVLSTPPCAPSGRAVLLLNAGTIHRIGPNRLYVRFARRWAEMGHHVLRLDLGGIGDSPSRPGDRENVIYHRHLLDDVREAVAFLRDRCGARDVRTMGLCSGAYHALTSALIDPGVSGFVAINPLTFFPRDGEVVDFPNAKVLAEAARYQQSLRELDKWKKLVSGKVRVRAAAKIFARYAGAKLARRARAVARRWNVHWGDDVVILLERLAKKGADQRFVFAAGDPGQRLLREEAGAVMDELASRGALAVDVIDGPDHTFTPVWSHERLAAALTAAIA